MKVKIAPSILSADFGRLGEQVQAAEEAGADYIHVDVMDGHFVPNLTLGPDIVAAIRRYTHLPLDVHLMIEAPDRWVERFAAAGASILTVHQEASFHLDYLVTRIRGLGVRAGVSLNPATPIGLLEEIVDKVDLVLLMTVNPGFGGQSLIPGTVDKLRRMAALMESRGSSAELEVDGGVNPENSPALVGAGARVLVAGSSIFNTRASVSQNLADLRRAAEEAVHA
jgi:ribulose-phosphate 3-epimerase